MARLACWLVLCPKVCKWGLLSYRLGLFLTPRIFLSLKGSVHCSLSMAIAGKTPVSPIHLDIPLTRVTIPAVLKAT